MIAAAEGLQCSEQSMIAETNWAFERSLCEHCSAPAPVVCLFPQTILSYIDLSFDQERATHVLPNKVNKAKIHKFLVQQKSPLTAHPLPSGAQAM